MALQSFVLKITFNVNTYVFPKLCSKDYLRYKDCYVISKLPSKDDLGVNIIYALFLRFILKSVLAIYGPLILFQNVDVKFVFDINSILNLKACNVYTDACKLCVCGIK